MNLTTNAIETCTDIQECMMAKKIKYVTPTDDHLHVLKTYVLNGWSSTRADIKDKIQAYWPF